MITASKARELAGPTLDEKIDSLGKTIEKLATEKRRKCRCGYDHKENNELWITGGYSTTEEWKQAKEKLENLGFKVSFFYEERQFVDMYTLIEW